MEFLVRLSRTSSLHGLDDTLFSEGPRNTDVVEINGERSAGKTLLLSQLIAKCILPSCYNGCGASAILINTDHHFQVSKLIELMTDIVDAAYATSSTPENIDADTDKRAVVENSLHNLRIIDCYDSEQFSLALSTLDDILIGDMEIALLAIDSITAYYWQDRQSIGVTTIDSYIKKLSKQIKVRASTSKVATIYTTPRETVIRDRGGKTVEINLSKSILDYRVHLHRTHAFQGLARTFQSGVVQPVKTVRYSILSNGIKWKRDEQEG